MKIAYMLKTVNSDMTAYHDFKWPKRGKVEAPDWDPAPLCGGGLHGLLDGEGDGTHLIFDPSAVWLVVKIDRDEVVELEGKVKVPQGSVVHCGNQVSATQYLQKKGLNGAIVGATVTRGAYGIATVGHNGTAVAGHKGTAVAGKHGTALAGIEGKAVVDAGGTAKVEGFGVAIAGTSGTAVAGDYGQATADFNGKAIAGKYGTTDVGEHGIAVVGEYGRLIFDWWARGSGRRQTSVFYVGEDGIKANTPYRCVDGKAIEVKE